MYRIGFLFAVYAPLIFLDWHARMVFIAVAYPRKYGHGKSGNRAMRHYKRTWSFIDRLLWRVVFKEYYEPKYRWLAWWAYMHFIFTIIMTVLILITLRLPDYGGKLLAYEILAILLFFCGRFIYSNAIARGEI